jgi:hypothetical protein
VAVVEIKRKEGRRGVEVVESRKTRYIVEKKVRDE